MMMTAKQKLVIVFAAIAICVIWSCSITSPTQSGSYKMLYDYQSSTLHPEYVLYHHADDSSTIYFRVKSAELLYSRTTAESPFFAQFKLRCISFDEASNVADTSSRIVTDYAREETGWLLGQMRVPMKQISNNIVVELTDLKRNTMVQNYMRSAKENTLSAQNYLLTDAHTDEPVFGGFAGDNQIVKVISARNRLAANQFYVGQYLGEMKLPPPPFSTSTPEMPDFTKTNDEIFDTDSAGHQLFLAEQGLYFITNDPERKQGTIISSSNDYFPEIKSLEQLPYPMRYITTKVEFEEIRENYYPKKKVDDFWLECGGSKDRARDLIRIYYNRVQEANYYFSSYTEGWRTDRGMIHIVFGNPSRIIKQQTYETWIYGEEGQSTVLTFVFKKQDNPFHSNIYVLNRDPAFKQYWEKQVTNWRNGRIYSE